MGVLGGGGQIPDYCRQRVFSLSTEAGPKSGIKFANVSTLKLGVAVLSILMQQQYFSFLLLI